MKVKDVYLKTMTFVWLKLAMGGALLLFSLVTLAIFFWLANLTSNPLPLYIWVILDIVVCGWVSRYVGYMLKAGHVAIVSKAVTTGSVPENQFQMAKEMVSKRFATSNVYFVVDRLVSGAVSQLQKGLGTVDKLLGGIPGVSAIISFLQLFIGIALGYVDECCLGYTFLKEDQSAFKSAADGVVIYFQNWKTLLKDAAITTLVVIVATFAAWLLPFIVFMSIFGALGLPWVIALIIAVVVAIALKSAFIDSYMMVKMMVSYMTVAPDTEITFDLYDKLCGLSAKFKELFNKGQQEQVA